MKCTKMWTKLQKRQTKEKLSTFFSNHPSFPKLFIKILVNYKPKGLVAVTNKVYTHIKQSNEFPIDAKS